MSPYAACPIVEIHPDPDGGLLAVVPDYPYGHGGSVDDFAVVETLAAVLAFADGRCPIWPAFPSSFPAGAADRCTQDASELYRHDKRKHGRICPACRCLL